MLIDFKLKMEKGSCAEQLKQDVIDETEEMTGIEFHQDYIEFLERCNGGEPREKYFNFNDNIKVVERFLCILENYKTDADGYYDVGVVWSQIVDRLNDYLLPFAVIFGGDFLCFDYEENPENPRVVLWNHDLSNERQPHTDFVADNLNEFLLMLYYKSDKELFETA